MANDTRIGAVSVLGAGTMGAQIAAHLANAGLPVLLLDVSPEAAREGLKRARALKPDPFFTRDAATLIATGGFEHDLKRISGSDWIIEAVVEQLDAKQHLFEQVEGFRTPGSIVSSNTSGIPIAALAQGRSADFRKHFVGTHFFNPPRYLRLLELIPALDTDPSVVHAVSWFADHRLGKGVVVAKDTPNFIANHIGVFGVIQVLRALATGEFTIEEIDAITGPVLGRPRSATFRTMDIAGIDILGHVARNSISRSTSDETRRAFAVPPLVDALIERGWVGEKAGQGFYKRSGSEILTLDPATLSYRPRQSARLPSLEAVSGIEDTGERVKALFLGRDKVGAFLRATLGPTLIYTAEVTPTIANSIDDVDRAMRWGFGWDLGPFELWDAIGITTVLEATQTPTIPPIVATGLKSTEHRLRTSALPPAAPDLQILKSAKDQQKVLRRNPGASLIDLGDGVLAVEFHSKMNAIGGDTVQMIHAGLKEAARNFSAMVIGTDAVDFSAGANLMLVLLEAQEGNWDEIDLMVRTFQQANLALKYSDVPVVAAPAGLTLGGGCEIVMHADRAQAAAEAYIGLVEVGVGLIPGGGGTKEMLVRTMRGAPKGDVMPFVQRAFETIAFATVSTSAAQAKALLYLREYDAITMNRERLMADAKSVALDRVRAGYQRPQPEAIPVGGERVEAALKLGVHLAWRAGRISDHDALIGRTLAHVLAGGTLPSAATVTEAQLLDLEREAFLRLCGERKTLERIQHTLKTGKPLRN
ncbi:MAG TPA: 3-hydroxyacyl-CoA dehydrogenase NAD-binding domain-containing protein [Vicinamibacterales bacterium]